MGPRFETIGEISNIETIASGTAIREIARLRRIYGRGRWRKRKGVAQIGLSGWLGSQGWYEASGIGRREFKIKYLL